MTQTYRTNDPARWGTGQGFNLSPAQVDINFWDLVQRMLAQEARPDPSAGILFFEINGIMFYVHMTDGSVQGPYELPVAIFRDRGPWLPNAPYSKMDTFNINGGLYVVLVDHTSDTTFDPGANDGAGNDFYQLMIQTPGSSLPGGGAVGQLLIKATDVDYSVRWGSTDADVVNFTPATGSSLSSFNVADALEELAAGAPSGLASDISYTPSTGSGLTDNNVQDAIDTLAERGTGLGKQTMWIPAASMTPRITNGPAFNTIEMSTNKNMVRTNDYDATTQEFAQFDVAMPKSWNQGTVTFRVYWSHAATTVNFGVSFGLEAVAASNSGLLDSAFGTAMYVNDVGGTANSQYISDESGPVTVTSSLVFPIMAMFRLCRYPADAGDNLAVDARVHGVQIYYAINETTDD